MDVLLNLKLMYCISLSKRNLEIIVTIVLFHLTITGSNGPFASRAARSEVLDDTVRFPEFATSAALLFVKTIHITERL